MKQSVMLVMKKSVVDVKLVNVLLISRRNTV